MGERANLYVFWRQRIADARRAVRFKASDAGIKYTCGTDGKEINLYYEDNSMWFVEGRAGF